MNNAISPELMTQAAPPLQDWYMIPGASYPDGMRRREELTPAERKAIVEDMLAESQELLRRGRALHAEATALQEEPPNLVARCDEVTWPVLRVVR